MRFGLIVVTATLLAGCGQTIEAKCNAAHGGDSSAAAACVGDEQSRILNAPGGILANKQRGGGG